jgi:hypothetical protein
MRQFMRQNKIALFRTCSLIKPRTAERVHCRSHAERQLTEAVADVSMYLEAAL